MGHRIGTGRKKGSRDKTKVERLVDMVIVASGGSHEDTVHLLSEHQATADSRARRGQDPVRAEFVQGNGYIQDYIRDWDGDDPRVQTAMQLLVAAAKNPRKRG